MNYYENIIKPFLAAYEGEEEAAQTETNDAPEEKGEDKMLSQREVNAIIAAEKKKFQERDQGRLKELETLRETFKGTKDEKDRLDKQIEQLRMDLMSAEDRAKADKENLRKQAESEKKVLESDRDLWKQRYTEETIARALTDAAGAERAISPEPLLAMLRHRTRLVPRIDKDTGQETGELIVKTRMSVPNEKGEVNDLDLTPAEAVRKMKEDDKYGYLFQGDKAPGIGGGQISDSKDLTSSLKGMDPKTYREKGRSHAMRL